MKFKSLNFTFRAWSFHLNIGSENFCIWSSNWKCDLVLERIMGRVHTMPDGKSHSKYFNRWEKWDFYSHKKVLESSGKVSLMELNFFIIHECFPTCWHTSQNKWITNSFKIPREMLIHLTDFPYNLMNALKLLVRKLRIIMRALKMGFTWRRGILGFATWIAF